MTAEEYLALERTLPKRHAFYRGEMFAMSGASRKHNLIAWNVGALLHGQLKGTNCEAYLSDMRVHVPSTGLYTYPDVVVTCEEPKFQDQEFDTLLNPQAIIEVVSESTEAYDRGRKFDQYRELESLKHYLLVAQKYASIHHYWCNDQGNWTLRIHIGQDDAVEIPTLGCRFPLADVYAKVTFPPTAEVDRAAGFFTAEESP